MRNRKIEKDKVKIIKNHAVSKIKGKLFYSNISKMMDLYTIRDYNEKSIDLFEDFRGEENGCF